MLYLLRGEEEAQGSPGGLDIWVVCATEEQVGQLACPGYLFYRLHMFTTTSDRVRTSKPSSSCKTRGLAGRASA